MKNNQNWENINVEAMTTPESEIIKENGDKANLDDNANTDSDEVIFDATDSTDEEVADENADEEAFEEEEPSSETEEDDEDKNVPAVAAKSNGMKTREKIILAVTGIVLLILLFLLIFSLFGGFSRGENDRPIVDTSISQTDGDSSTDDNTGITDSDGNINVTIPSDTDDDSDKKDTSDTDQSHVNKGDNESDDDDDGSEDDGGNGTSNDSVDENKPDTDGKNDDDSDENDDEKNDDDNNSDGTSKPNDDENQNADDNTASDYAGETKVRISTINDDTGIITITIDGTSVVVPVQTTVFNGRVTKSGVAQCKLFGYNSGITVMLYYPQEEGFDYDTVAGYMNRSDKSLTVLVDINGDGSKLMIKVNGMKSLM